MITNLQNFTKFLHNLDAYYKFASSAYPTTLQVKILENNLKFEPVDDVCCFSRFLNRMEIKRAWPECLKIVFFQVLEEDIDALDNMFNAIYLKHSELFNVLSQYEISVLPIIQKLDCDLLEYRNKLKIDFVEGWYALYNSFTEKMCDIYLRIAKNNDVLCEFQEVLMWAAFNDIKKSFELHLLYKLEKIIKYWLGIKHYYYVAITETINKLKPKAKEERESAEKKELKLVNNKLKRVVIMVRKDIEKEPEIVQKAEPVIKPFFSSPTKKFAYIKTKPYVAIKQTFVIKNNTVSFIRYEK